VREVLGANHAPVDLGELGGEAVALPYTEFQMGEQDVLFISNASGGGFGDPLDRAPSMVANDVLEGLVSIEVAREVYGVVLRAGAVNIEATELTRGLLREERHEELRSRTASQKVPTSPPSLTLAIKGGGDWSSPSPLDGGGRGRG
jgi:N-methylhydantoinase B